jgi:hypothetical protein
VLLTVIFRVVTFAILLSSCNSTVVEPECDQNSQCGAGLECRLGTCRPAPSPDAGSPSSGDGGVAPLACAGFGTCQIGQRCEANIDCLTRFCADGVCCTEQCSGTCSRCNTPGLVGVCKAKAKDSSCGNYRCDGDSLECRSTCDTVAQCAYGFACCLPNAPGYEDCNQRGLARTCFRQPLCRTLTDTFDGSALDTTQWRFSNDEGAVRLSEGRLVLKPAIGEKSNTAYAFAQRIPRCSMVNSSVSVEVTGLEHLRDAAALAVVHLTAAAKIDRPGAYEVYLNAGTVRPVPDVQAKVTYADVDAGTSFSAPNQLSTGASQFIRLSEDAGRMIFSSSPNGVNYTAFESVPVTTNPGDVEIFVGLYLDRPRPDAGPQINFDNLNVDK